MQRHPEHRDNLVWVNFLPDIILVNCKYGVGNAPSVKIVVAVDEFENVAKFKHS